MYARFTSSAVSVGFSSAACKHVTADGLSTLATCNVRAVEGSASQMHCPTPAYFAPGRILISHFQWKLVGIWLQQDGNCRAKALLSRLRTIPIARESPASKATSVEPAIVALNEYQLCR